MTVTNRAYSLLDIKEMDDEKREIRGIASTPTPDRMADVVVPQGAKFVLPIPLLWQHDSSQPIGQVTEAKVTKSGIEIVASIAKGVSGEIDRAWNLIKAGLVRGLSIGFRGIDADQIPNSWGVIYNTWEWLELSAVTIPANAEATITTVKKFDTGVPASPPIQPDPPAATGKNVRVVKLNDPARDRAKPFVIRKINPVR
jgi:HK97 family phage prohead protease